MRKALSLLLALVLCLSLCACSGEQDTQYQKPNNDNINNDNTSQAEEALIIQNPDYGTIINIKRFNELLTTVELTTENWMNYIEVCACSKEIVEKDAFGEIISIKTDTWQQLGAKGNKYHHFRDFVIELKNKETGELELYYGNNGTQPTVTKSFNLDQYECTRIKGTLYLIDVPEEVIIQPKEGNPFFNVGYLDVSYGPAYTCFIYGRLVGGMFDLLLY